MDAWMAWCENKILDIAAQNKILAFEQALTVHTLTNGDEVFLTNAIKGVQWVGRV